MTDPFTLISSLVTRLFTGKAIVVIALVLIIAVASMVISRAVVEIAPIIHRTIDSTTALLEKTSEVLDKVDGIQEGFQSALRQIDSMQETIARIERIVNRIPIRLLNDEETGEWDTSWMYEEPQQSYEHIPYPISDKELGFRKEIADILRSREYPPLSEEHFARIEQLLLSPPSWLPEEKKEESKVEPQPQPQPQPIPFVPQGRGFFRR